MIDSYEKITAMIREIGLPCVYHHFDVGHVPALPCIVYSYETNKDFLADNRVYKRIISVTLELYADAKNFAAEYQIESILSKYCIVYEREEDYTAGENIFIQTYAFEVMLDGEESCDCGQFGRSSDTRVKRVRGINSTGDEESRPKNCDIYKE